MIHVAHMVRERDEFDKCTPARERGNKKGKGEGEGEGEGKGKGKGKGTRMKTRGRVRKANRICVM